MAGRELSAQERSAILESQIAPYVANGFLVTSRTEGAAQLVKGKQFGGSGCLNVALFIISGGLITLIQFIIYLGAKDQSVYIEVDPYGNVKTR
jgi:hypothetical protein